MIYYKALTDPVKVTFLTRLCRHSFSLKAGVFASVVGRTLNKPLGKPACSPRYARDSAVRGVSGDGFTIIVQPAAKAALAFRRTMLEGLLSVCYISPTREVDGGNSTYAMGKFHGT